MLQQITEEIAKLKENDRAGKVFSTEEIDRIISRFPRILTMALGAISALLDHNLDMAYDRLSRIVILCEGKAIHHRGIKLR